MIYEVKKSVVKRLRVRIATIYAITFNAYEVMLLFKSYLLALSVEEVHIALGLSNSQLIELFKPLQDVFISFPFFIAKSDALKQIMQVDLTSEQLLAIKNALEVRIAHCEQERDSKGASKFNESSWLDMRMLRCDLSEMYTTAIQPVDEVSMVEDKSEEPVEIND